MTKNELFSYRAVIFDIDGTLYPIKYLNRQFRKLYFSHPIITSNFFKARKLIRVKNSQLEYEQTNREEFLKLQAECIGKGKNYFDVFYKGLSRKRKLVPYNGIENLLIELKSKGITLGVLSDFPVETKLKELGLDEYFNIKLSTEDVGFLKPDIRAFKYLKKNLAVAPQECVYVGDSVTKDINGSKNAGFTPLLINELLSIIKE